MAKLTVRLRVGPHQFAVGPALWLGSGWRPGPVEVLSSTPHGNHVIGAVLPMRGGMYIVAYNRWDQPVTVWLAMAPGDVALNAR